MKRRSTPAILAALLLVAVMAVTAAFPELDLGVARRFYEAEGGSFSARFDTTLMGLREIGFYLPVALLAPACLGWLYGRWNAEAAKLFTGRRLMFLTLSFALGPGLIVNVILKNASHRPRPTQVETFGGANPFRPWYAFDGGCATNCSFVSGEVAGAAWRNRQARGVRARSAVRSPISWRRHSARHWRRAASRPPTWSWPGRTSWAIASPNSVSPFRSIGRALEKGAASAVLPPGRATMALTRRSGAAARPW